MKPVFTTSQSEKNTYIPRLADGARQCKKHFHVKILADGQSILAALALPYFVARILVKIHAEQTRVFSLDLLSHCQPPATKTLGQYSENQDIL